MVTAISFSFFFFFIKKNIVYLYVCVCIFVDVSAPTCRFPARPEENSSSSVAGLESSHALPDVGGTEL